VFVRRRWGEKAWVRTYKANSNLHQMSFCACVVYWARPLSHRAGSLGWSIVREMVSIVHVIFHTCRPHKLIQDQQWNQLAKCFTTSQLSEPHMISWMDILSVGSFVVRTFTFHKSLLLLFLHHLLIQDYSQTTQQEDTNHVTPGWQQQGRRPLVDLPIQWLER